ncbi:carboxypeptidase S [Cytidiella melzeri]|nr:carboxypeptidase S [Cytidiella melzeri]
MSEKENLLPTARAAPDVGRRRGLARKLHLIPLLLLGLGFSQYLWLRTIGGRQDADFSQGVKQELCPQPSTLTPSKNGDLWQSLSKSYETKEFQDRAIVLLSEAVQIPTQSYDQMQPVGVDPRWDAFGPFHDYLLSAFPKVHTTLKVTKVNTWGLIYDWEGSDTSLKPLLLAAHQDVVPVNPETVDKWTHPPWSGEFDGEKIWGRGSADDKGGLISILTTIETLLANGFKPTRKVVLAFGFDEEASGIYGASSLATYLEQSYGKNAFAMIVDEGGEYMIEFGKAYATVGTAEKGYSDVRVSVTSPGGHSSVPPPHTTIGILSALLVQIEANPSIAKLNRGTPMFQKSQCLAAYGTDLPKSLRNALKRASRSDKALRQAEQALFEDHKFQALVGTTLAVDLIFGGVKTNALPESAYAVINHRIATDSSISETWQHDVKTLESLASSFNLSFTAFGKQVTDADAVTYGTLTLSDAWGVSLEPAPITPSEGDEAAPFKLLAGTIKAAHNTFRNITGDDNVVVSPGIMSGNTDTRYYWNLSNHIFRYGHNWSGDRGWVARGAHTVNEVMFLDSYLEMIRFFTTLILNADESTSL